MSSDDAPEPSKRRDEPPRSEGREPANDPRYDEFTITDETYTDAAFVGTANGFPVYHGDGKIFRGDVDERAAEVTPIPDSERTLEPEETLGDVLEEIGETIGWERLSEYGKKHRSE